MSLVCKQFRDICKGESFWQERVLQDFSIMFQDRNGNSITSQPSWKNVYKILHLMKHLERKQPRLKVLLMSKYAVDYKTCSFCSNTLVPEELDNPPDVMAVECPNCHFCPCQVLSVEKLKSIEFIAKKH